MASSDLLKAIPYKHQHMIVTGKIFQILPHQGCLSGENIIN